MKTVFALSAALLLTTMTFAQTSVNNRSNAASATSLSQTGKKSGELSGSGTASSATSVRSNEIGDAKQSTMSTSAKAAAAAEATQQKAGNEVKSNMAEAKQASSNDENVSAGARSNAGVNAAAEGNKSGENASLKSQISLSAEPAKREVSKLGEKGKMMAENGVSAGSEKALQVKSATTASAARVNEKIQARTVTRAKAGSNAAAAATHPAVSVKMAAHVKTNTGLQIR